MSTNRIGIVDIRGYGQFVAYWPDSAIVDELPEDRRLDVFLAAINPRSLDDTALIGLDVGDADARDAHRHGREGIRYLLRHPDLQAAWAVEQRRLGSRFQKHELAIVWRDAGPLPKAARPRAMVDDDLVNQWVPDHAGKATVLASGEVATPLGLDVDAVPEQTVRPVHLMFLLVGRDRQGAIGIVAHRGVGDYPPTTRPQRAVAEWMRSEDRHVVGSRESLFDDAKRLGARIVYAVRGALPSEVRPDLADEIATLKQRLAALEGRTTAPTTTVTDDGDVVRF
jgi:hypothetical protein